MKIVKIGEPKIIMSNPTSRHNYFAWPTIARLKNGRIAVAASGFRLSHACPFGKTVMSFSDDEAETYTLPMPVIDTFMDDRDGGLTPFGESSVCITSINDPVDFYRQHTNTYPWSKYAEEYLDTISQEESDNYLGSLFRISHDNGVTFGPIGRCPVSSPHGPVALPDGTLLWLGKMHQGDEHGIRAYKIDPRDESVTCLCEIEGTNTSYDETFYDEPHVVLLDDGTLLAHIRIQKRGVGKYDIFSICQSESYDYGKTWTQPRLILDPVAGAPAHLYKTSSGMLISARGYRIKPTFGVKVMFSKDNGKTWTDDQFLYENTFNADLGYPTTVELKDGTFLTVFYAAPEQGKPPVVMQQKWRLEDGDAEQERPFAETADDTNEASNIQHTLL